MTFRQGVLGKENVEERVEGKEKAQESTKGGEKPNAGERDDAGEERKLAYGAYSILIHFVVGNEHQD